MTREADLALLAGGSYWDVRGDLIDPISGEDRSNRAPLPEGWRVLSIDLHAAALISPNFQTQAGMLPMALLSTGAAT